MKIARRWQSSPWKDGSRNARSYPTTSCRSERVIRFSDDPRYFDVRKAIDYILRIRHVEGISKPPVKAEVISIEAEEKMWQDGYRQPGSSTPTLSFTLTYSSSSSLSLFVPYKRQK